MGRRKARVGAVSKGELERLGYAAGGAVVGLLVNYGIKQVVKNQDESTKKTLGTALPLAKLVIGGLIAAQSKDARLRDFGIGMGAGGAMEFALQTGSPYFNVSIGGWGDLYPQIGNPYYDRLPGAGVGDIFEENNAIAGVEGEMYENMIA
jgi:hypothetical protein